LAPSNASLGMSTLTSLRSAYATRWASVRGNNNTLTSSRALSRSSNSSNNSFSKR
jgi:hypothetical protein